MGRGSATAVAPSFSNTPTIAVATAAFAPPAAPSNAPTVAVATAAVAPPPGPSTAAASAGASVIFHLGTVPVHQLLQWSRRH